MGSAYKIQELSKTYRKSERYALDGLSFEVPAGEVVAIVGPNGAGKTTLVKLLLGLLTPTSGTVFLEDEAVTAVPGIVARKVSYLPQQGFGRALAALSVREAVEALGRLKGLTAAESARQAGKLIGSLGLEKARDERLSRSSGGQRRLAALAGVLIGDRPILILDEPTNDLDAEARQRVWDILGDIRRAGRTIILVTHNVLEADRIVDRVVLIADGRLVACSPLTALKEGLDRLTVDLWSTDPLALAARAASESGAEISAGGRRLRFVCGRERFGELAGWLARAGNDSGVHWTVRTPTLEDVYFEMSGGKR
ncbi:MAG: ABC transporter ATP-binding protein [Elusimicrobiota bacterium]